MLETRGDQGFAQEANFADVATREELLDGHITSKLSIAGLGDAAEAAATMLRDHLVAVGVANVWSHESRGGSR